MSYGPTTARGRTRLLILATITCLIIGIVLGVRFG